MCIIIFVKGRKENEMFVIMDHYVKKNVYKEISRSKKKTLNDNYGISKLFK